jgi:adenosylcobinamide-phosphate synthase
MPGPTCVRRPVALVAGLLLGAGLDHLLADPRHGHPVAGFGLLAGRLERRMWTDDRVRGAAYWTACVGPVVGAAVLANRLGGVRRVVVVAGATWTVLGGRSLQREALTVSGQLEAGDLAAARVQLTHLVGRDTTQLDAGEIARAAVESVAENTCDAIVAPLLWGAVAGLPGLLGYRAVNTLDAMVGHHSTRYERFGWAAARLDDLANAVPARVSAGLIAAVAPVVGGSAGDTLRTARRDGRRHPSPNAGFSEAAFAGALGIRLGGRNDYAGRIEERPVLGDGRPAAVADLDRAARLCGAVGGAAAAGAATLALVLGRRR